MSVKKRTKLNFTKNTTEMREILFRGINKITKEWVFGDLCQNSNNGILIVEEIRHIDGREYAVDEYEVNPETVGEFTGIEDKNGNKIFEGDILSYPDFRTCPGPNYIEGEEFTNKGEIFWNKELCAWDISNVQGISRDDFFEYSAEIEIEGNIHQHKHLMK